MGGEHADSTQKGLSCNRTHNLPALRRQRSPLHRRAPPNPNPCSKNYITPLNYFAVGVSFDHTCSAKVVNFSLSPLPAPTSAWEATRYFSSVSQCAEPAVSLAVAMLSYQGPPCSFPPDPRSVHGGINAVICMDITLGKQCDECPSHRWWRTNFNQQWDGSCSKPADVLKAREATGRCRDVQSNLSACLRLEK